MATVFIVMALIAFVGFGIQAALRNGHGMIYAAVLFVIWVALFLWWTGRIG